MVLCLASLTNPPYITFYSDSPQLSDGDIQGYHDAYAPRMDEMHAFNMVGRPDAPRKNLKSVVLSDITVGKQEVWWEIG